MTSCDLCGLAVRGPPVTNEDGQRFCCPGCREVSARLDPSRRGADAPDASSIRDAFDTIGDRAARDSNEEPDATPEAVAYLRVDGMHCATCEAFLEARTTSQDGVTKAEASYPADMLRVGYDPDRVDASTLPELVSGYGYRAHAIEKSSESPDGPPWRMLVGAFFGMMVMMWYLLFLYPAYAGLVSPTDAGWGQTGRVSLVNLWVATTVVVAVTGYPILRGALVSLRTGLPNMDLLVSLAIVGAYAYSAIAAILGQVDVYFDVVVVIVLAVSLGRYVEDRFKRRAKGQLAALAAERVTDANRRGGTGIESVPIEDLEAGDEVVVRPGERVPVDGMIVEGEAAIDESVVTGESVPIDAGPGERVIAGAVVTDSAIVVAAADPDDRTIDRLLARMWDLQSARRGAGRLADRLASVFVPLVAMVAAGTVGVRLLLGGTGEAALLSGLAVLVVACPCALGLATPLAVAAGTRASLAAGVIVRDPGVFEVAPKVDVIAIDKTGTLTTGEMRVSDEPADEKALARAGAVEALSAHPIAQAIANRAGVADRAVSDFDSHPGRGAEAVVDGERVLVGSVELFTAENWAVPPRLEGRVDKLRERGIVPVLVGWDGTARDVIGVGDQPRPGWAEILASVGDGRTVAVLTGDAERATQAFRDHPAVDLVLAGLPPEGKAEAVSRLGREGTVAMVGDGTNDAPAMAAADLGIAIGTGAALTAEAADIVLVNDGLANLESAVTMATATRRRIRENLAWAFAYNGLAIPAAVFGLLNPLVAAGAMATSSLLVVANSVRGFGPVDDTAVDEPERTSAPSVDLTSTGG